MASQLLGLPGLHRLLLARECPLPAAAAALGVQLDRAHAEARRARRIPLPSCYTPLPCHIPVTPACSLHPSQAHRSELLSYLYASLFDLCLHTANRALAPPPPGAAPEVAAPTPAPALAPVTAPAPAPAALPASVAARRASLQLLDAGGFEPPPPQHEATLEALLRNLLADRVADLAYQARWPPPDLQPDLQPELYPTSI